MADLSDDELLAELGVAAESPRVGAHTPREERIIAGFEDIVRFFESHGRAPRHGESLDIFERLYAVRLDQIRKLPKAVGLLSSLDTHDLLSGSDQVDRKTFESLDDESLLSELGVTEPGDDGDIRTLRNVVSRAEIKTAEEIANRTRCVDFDRFKPLLEQAQSDLKHGHRQTRKYGKDTSIDEGSFFVLGGQVVYVAGVGEEIKAPNGESDARLRVIFANGTESNLLRRSLQRALYKDDAGRRLTEPDAGPLFSGDWDKEDIASGTIYVLRSLSKHPFIEQHRELIHKIGVTGGSVEARIADAKHDATYLLADVEIIASYKLADINRTKLESLFHKLFAAAQLDLTIEDRFGNPVRPREWFLVPLQVIDEAVTRIRDGSITSVEYEPSSAQLIQK
jgi:hypothetical protein